MSKVLAALKQVVADLAALQTPTLATAVAGIVAPIVAAVAGANITAAEIGGWLVVVGTVAATIQKLTAKPANIPPKPSK